MLSYWEFLRLRKEALQAPGVEKLLELEERLKEFLPHANMKQSWVGAAFADVHWDLDERGFYLRGRVPVS